MNKLNFVHGFMGRIATVALLLLTVCGGAKAQEVLTADNVEIIAGKTAKVSINYSSEVERSGFQMSIALPEGLSFVSHDVDGESQICTLGDATLPTHVLSETIKGNVNNVVVFHLNVKGLKDGELLSFEVQADKDFPEEADITISKIKFNGGQYLDNMAVKVTRMPDPQVINDEAYARLSAEVEALRQDLTTALAGIAETCPGVKDEFTGAEIVEIIDAVQAKLDAASEAVELTAESNIDEDKAIVAAAIEKLVADATAAQTEKEKQDANAVAYTKLSVEVAELRTALATALAGIAASCPDVKDNFTGAEITETINAVQTKLDVANEAVELTAEDNINADKLAVNEAIQKLVADAAAAQAAFVADTAAYAKLSAEVAELQDALVAALADIAETCPGVKDDFTGIEIAEAIATIQAKLDAAHEAGELTAESDIDEDKSAVNAAIAKLVADATAAQAVLVLEEGTYYIRNVETGAFLVGGNSWGTQATAAESGIDWIVTIANGKYMFDSQITNGGENHYLGTNGFVDSNAKLNITLVEEGVYSIVTDEGLVLTAPAADAETTVVTFEENADDMITQRWQFVTKEELDAELAEATETNVLDATYLIRDANFGRNDLRKEAWTMEAANQNLSGGNNINNCAESYHSVFTLSQTMSVPNGVYALTAQGFFRQDGEDYENLPYFFANDETASFSEMAGTENNMSDASVAFTEGLYTITPIIVEVTDGTLTVGAKNDANESLWCIWDNFCLSYYGADADVNKIKNAVAIDGVRGEAVTATVGIYSVSGVKLSEMQKGLNIIVGEDGTVRKVFVK